MSLERYKVSALVAVSDMERARDFYEGKLGLAAGGDDPDAGRTYTCGEQTELHVFPSVAGAGASGATVAGWYVPDIESVVDELTANGIAFEHYDEPPLVTDARGIAVLGPNKGAWFKDPDGNILGLLQE
ncbi:MAG TPA: VOC family protein [Solirubrobacteraceae bacterium]|nr:VOC family protein [Solirubrobacteraceae bacterium]